MESTKFYFHTFFLCTCPQLIYFPLEKLNIIKTSIILNISQNTNTFRASPILHDIDIDVCKINVYMWRYSTET